MARLNNSDVDIRDRELVITRVFDAPRKLVYKVWTDPRHITKWWGPSVFTAPVCEVDLRPGGAYLYVMRSPEGMEFPVRGKFIEIITNERLVYTDDMFEQKDMWKQMIGSKVSSDLDFSILQNVITVVFEDEGSKTKLTLTTRFALNEVRDAMVGMQMAEGWTSSLDKFAAELKNA